MSDFRNIGKYEIRRQIGRGAMGVVFEGFDPQIERRLAVKVLRLDLFDPSQFADIRARFKREAQSAGQLSHPNIVTVYDYGENEGSPFIAMEFLAGNELSRILDRGTRLPMSEVVRLMGQLLSALAYAHERKVVHRDIKPGNIFVLADGSLKVVDFGLARVESSELTHSGALLGTPAYMSPEQCLALSIDERSDIFSAGVILYELLTGDKPFTGSVTSIIQKVLHQEPIEPTVLNPTIPAVWNVVIKRAMAKKPEARFQSARQFAETIKQVVDKGAQEVSVETTLTGAEAVAHIAEAQLRRDRPRARKPLPKKRIVVGLTAGVVVVVAGLIYATNQVREDQSASTQAASSRMPACPGRYDPTTWTNCFGRLISSNGAKYAGTFKAGEYHGEGTLIWSSGRKYVGGWKNGQFHGQGTDSYPDGASYVGEYADDKRYGHGIYTWADKTTYDGWFKGGEFQGDGTQTFPDGRKYVGRWREGERHGEGIEYRSDGTVLRAGIWDQGDFAGPKGNTSTRPKSRSQIH